MEIGQSRGDLHSGLDGMYRFSGWKFVNRVKKFAINSQTEDNFYDDFLKWWKF